MFIEIIIPTERRLMEAELTDDMDGIIPEGGQSVSQSAQSAKSVSLVLSVFTRAD